MSDNRGNMRNFYTGHCEPYSRHSHDVTIKPDITTTKLPDKQHLCMKLCYPRLDFAVCLT